MKNANRTFVEILRKNSDHVTYARRQVFEALYGKHPQSMNELYRRLEHVVDRSSVYRAISLFEKRGIVHKIRIGWKYKIELSDIFMNHHHHISCLRCGRVVAMRQDYRLESLIFELAKENNFSEPVHQFEIQGNCWHCTRVS